MERRGRRLAWLIAGLMVLLCAGALDVSAGDEGTGAPERAGLRSGVSASSFEDLYYEVDAYADWDLPWRFDLGRRWRLGTGVDVSAGWLAARGNSAFIASAGPLFVLKRDRLPLEFEAGFSPTVLSRQRFDQDDLGSWCQFTSHAAVLWEAGRHFLIGYRFQHMSNGGISEDNPGLNLHCLVLGWRF